MNITALAEGLPIALLALCVSSVALFLSARREHRDSRIAKERQEEREGTLAAGVAGWVEVREVLAEGRVNGVEFSVAVRNNSELPVRHLMVRVINDADALVHFAYHQVVAPSITLWSSEEIQDEDAWCDYYRVSLTFTDSGGRRWHRSPAGKLQQLPSKFTVFAGVDVRRGLADYRDRFRDEFSLEVDVDTDRGGTDLRRFFSSTDYYSSKCDAIVGPHDWLGHFRERSLLAPVPVPRASPRDPLIREAFEVFDVGAESAGVPLAYDTVVLFVNRDIYAGELPESVESLFAAGHRCVSANKRGPSVPGVSLSMGEHPGEGDPFMIWPILTSLGGFLFEPEGASAWIPSERALQSEGLFSALMRLQAACTGVSS